MDCLHHADRPFLLVHFNLHDGLGLVVEFRADVAAGVFIILVLVQDGVDVDLPVVGPLHEMGDDVGRLLGRVDIVEQVADAIYNHQTEVGDGADGMVDYGQPHVGREFAQRQHHQIVGIPLLGQSRQPQDAPQYLLAVGPSLLGVDVEDAPLLFGEGGAVVQHRAVRQGRRGEGRDVECLFALGLPDRGAEVSQRTDHGAVHPQQQASAARTADSSMQRVNSSGVGVWLSVVSIAYQFFGVGLRRCEAIRASFSSSKLCAGGVLRDDSSHLSSSSR